MENSLKPQDTGQRLRELRQELGLSLRACAGRAGVAVSFLSKVEAGRASPTLMTLQKILESLDTDLGTFFRAKAAPRASRTVFPRRAMKLVQDRERKWWVAFPRRHDIRMNLTYEEYQPKTRTVESEEHVTDLCGFVIEGELTIQTGAGKPEVARPGDAFYLKAGMTHVAINRGSTPLRIVAVQTRP